MTPFGRRVALAACLVLATGCAGAAVAFEGSVYIAEDGQTLGPFSEAELREKIRSRAEAARTLVWHRGLEGWRRATEVPRLTGFVRALPAETPVDLAAHVLGTWTSTDWPVAVPGRTMIGRLTVTFEGEGAFRGTMVAEHVDISWVPGGPVQTTPEGAVLRPPQVMIDRSIRHAATLEGTWRIADSDDSGAPAILLEGEIRNLESGDVDRMEDPWTVGDIAPDRMRMGNGATLTRE